MSEDQFEQAVVDSRWVYSRDANGNAHLQPCGGKARTFPSGAQVGGGWVSWVTRSKGKLTLRLLRSRDQRRVSVPIDAGIVVHTSREVITWTFAAKGSTLRVAHLPQRTARSLSRAPRAAIVARSYRRS